MQKESAQVLVILSSNEMGFISCASKLAFLHPVTYEDIVWYFTL